MKDSFIKKIIQSKIINNVQIGQSLNILNDAVKDSSVDNYSD